MGRRPNKSYNGIGLAILLLGVLILLAIILPAKCWWLILGIGLIVGGLLILRSC